MQSEGCNPLAGPAGPNPTSQSRHTTISDAARHLVAQLVPGDRLGRTYAEVIVSALIARACGGDVQAMRLIFQITEGDAETRQTQKKREVVVRVVYGDRPRHAVEPEQGRA